MSIRNIRFFHLIGGLVLFVILGSILAACNSPFSSVPPTPTPVPPSNAPVQDCGKIALAPNGTVLKLGSGQQISQCFLTAYQHCQSATLTFAQSGVDTITTHIFTIKQAAGQCAIVDVSQHTVIPQPPKTLNTYICTGVTQQQNALKFTACGSDGDITVPTV